MPGPYDLVVTFLAYTGLRVGEMAALRVGEMAALRVGDVDLSHRRVNVVTNVVEVACRLVRQTPKTHRTRSVPFPRFLADEIAGLTKERANDEPLFTSPTGAMLRNNNLRHRVFDPAVRRAGLASLTPHDLRDTAASLAVSSGASVKAVQRMLVHASAAMTLDVYAGLFDDGWTALQTGCIWPQGAALPTDPLRTDCGLAGRESATHGRRRRALRL